MLIVYGQVARIIYFIFAGLAAGYIVQSFYVYYRLRRVEQRTAERVRWHVPLMAPGVLIMIGSDAYDHVVRLIHSEVPGPDLPAHVLAVGFICLGLRSLVRRSRSRL